MVLRTKAIHRGLSRDQRPAERSFCADVIYMKHTGKKSRNYLPTVLSHLHII